MIKSQSNFNLHPLLKDIEGNKILDYRLRTRIDEKYIPQYFNKKIVFQSFASFQQNNLFLSKIVRKFVLNNITTQYINAIGGESYLYTKYNNNKNIGYTNSPSIYNDAIYNGFQNMNCIDYNKDKIELKMQDTIINLSKLNQSLMKQINISTSNRIIIINCHHNDFWKKIKILKNYRLVKRKQFIDYKSNYFLTVNIFLRKSFVSLGGNCSITYQLNKLKLRNKAYPFDWSKNKLNQVINVLKNDFKDYEKITISKYSDLHNSYIVKNKYVSFAHEVLNSHENNLIFETKLLRRIERFKEIKNPIFVRIELNSYKNKKIYIDYWIELIDILKSYFTNFKIILISSINPKLKEIKWIKYDTFTSDWKNNHLDWFNILYFNN